MQKTWQKFPLLLSLYIAQAVPMSFFSTVVPVIMRQENYSLEVIGMLQLVKLPWILKFLWAPLVDKRAKTTVQLKRWIIGSELCYAIFILLIGLFSLQTDFKLIIILMVIAFIASATQDIATDTYAILILRPEERSLGNGMQSAGGFLGSLFGTGFLLIAYAYFGWSILLILLAAFVSFAIIPLLFFREERLPPIRKSSQAGLKDILSFFTAQGMKKRVMILMTYYSGIFGILAMLKPYLVDLGYSVQEIGFMSGIVGTSAAALAAFGAGWLLKRIGLRAGMFLFWVVNLLTGIYFYFMSLGSANLSVVYGGICLLWCAYGLSTVVIYTSSMNVVRKDREGTDFTLQIVLTHLSGLVLAVAGGKLADQFGYSALFQLEICLSVLTFFILFYTLPDKEGSTT